jgi:3-methylfumaryl-CoA hydratase
MSALLDRTDAEPRLGDALPALWHWLYFWPTTAQSELGEDGHPKRGGFLPPVPFPKRMWAGGRLQWHQPMRLGDTIERRSRIDRVQHKTGRSGELLFVQVQHSYQGPQGLCLEETHDIVYKPLALGHEPMSAGILPTLTPEWQRELVPDDVLLFRYSALTFNSHRIHYDRRYAMQTEGYPGLVVHGPLMASLLVDLLRRHHGRSLSSFAFKALKPVFECADQRTLRLCAATPAEEVHAWVQDHEGHVCMQAVAHWSSHTDKP